MRPAPRTRRLPRVLLGALAVVLVVGVTVAGAGLILEVVLRATDRSSTAHLEPKAEIVVGRVAAEAIVRALAENPSY